MPVRAHVANNPETLSDLLLAAEDRYADAEELLVQCRFDGAVYLLGYAAEIWLKAVCLKLRGAIPTSQVKAALGPLKAFMTLTAPHVAFTNYHDLSYLVECVAALRLSAGRPLPAALETELRTRVGGLHGEWIVDMRYRRVGVTSAEVWAALINAWWLKTNWVHLT